MNAVPSTAGLAISPTFRGSRPDKARQIVGLAELFRKVDRNEVTSWDVVHVDGGWRSYFSTRPARLFGGDSSSVSSIRI